MLSYLLPGSSKPPAQNTKDAASSGKNPPHPLQPLCAEEIEIARKVIVGCQHASEVLLFRSIQLQEPEKAVLLLYLEAEITGKLESLSKRPPRLAVARYSVVSHDKHCHFITVVDIHLAEVVSMKPAPAGAQPGFSADEMSKFEETVKKSKVFQEALEEFSLPEDFDVVLDTWPFGGFDGESLKKDRYCTGMVYAKPTKTKDSNHYSYPIPVMPIVNGRTFEVLSVERIATGGIGDGIFPLPKGDKPKKLFQHSRSAEYLPENIEIPLRTDLKPIHITQPEGTSFKVHQDQLIEWQKWRFRLSFNAREGAVLHDIRYDGRPTFYRLSISEMTVPYSDPRPPYHRKQAFDLGDVGVGRTANSLQLGCDCLGAIHYVDFLDVKSDGSSKVTKAVVCIHEQDNGILWKHTDFRTGRAASVRNRELVVQFVATLANYEYIFSYHLDLAGAITMETRATGIVSVANIDDGKTSTYGNVVSPGVLAQGHQHVFAVRVDPAIDSYRSGHTRVVMEESVGRKIHPETNPFGNLYEVERKPIDKPQGFDLEPRRNRLVKMENTRKKNAYSGKNVSYKLMSPTTQLLLADDESVAAKRAQFARHHIWVTGYRDDELFAAGEYTNMSTHEMGGVADMVKRPDRFVVDESELHGEGENEEATHPVDTVDPVVWAVFGLTHNPRTEDWPVMPFESFQIHLKPNDFFIFNPSLDVPPTKCDSSVSVPCCTNGNA